MKTLIDLLNHSRAEQFRADARDIYVRIQNATDQTCNTVTRVYTHNATLFLVRRRVRAHKNNGGARRPPHCPPPGWL